MAAGSPFGTQSLEQCTVCSSAALLISVCCALTFLAKEWYLISVRILGGYKISEDDRRWEMRLQILSGANNNKMYFLFISSRSRSRSYSPSHNRERNHPRVYQNRDFRGHNRGYRRPYYFRGRNRGFYPWGQYNRGGYGNYRSNWQNYRQAYSPRRGRSRSRSPKRRSPSPRSRSHSRNSDKSSSDRSRRSSSSRSSSNHSRVESSKRKSGKDKKSSSKEARASQAAGENQGDDSKEQPFSGAAAQDAKASEGSKPWQDVSAYGSSSASRAAAPELSPRERSPALKSPLQSVVVRRRSPRPSPLQKSSSPLSNPSQMSSASQSSTSFQAGSHQSPFDHGSSGLSPTRKSPVCKSPTPISSMYGASQKEETTAPGGGAFSKRQVACSFAWQRSDGLLCMGRHSLCTLLVSAAGLRSGECRGWEHS